MKKNEEMKKTPLPNVPPTLPIRNAQPMAPFTGLTPFHTMRRMTDEVEKMFGDLFNFNMALNPFFMATPALPTFEDFELPVWTPQIEVSNKKGELKVRADLPGMKPEDIELEIIDNNLLISGERTMENEEEREGFYRTERNYGSFFRSIPLPEGADTEHVAAIFNNGVLEIAMHVPTAKKRGKKVEIATHKPAVKAKAA
jgi:HSP20 family protein